MMRRGGGVEQVELVVDALVVTLFVADEVRGVARPVKRVQFADALLPRRGR